MTLTIFAVSFLQERLTYFLQTTGEATTETNDNNKDDVNFDHPKLVQIPFHCICGIETNELPIQSPK